MVKSESAARHEWADLALVDHPAVHPFEIGRRRLETGHQLRLQIDSEHLPGQLANPRRRDGGQRLPPSRRCRRRTNHRMCTSTWRALGSGGARASSPADRCLSPVWRAFRGSRRPSRRGRPRCKRPVPATGLRAAHRRWIRRVRSTRHEASRERSGAGHANADALSAHARCDSHSRPSNVRRREHSSTRSPRRWRHRKLGGVRERNSG